MLFGEIIHFKSLILADGGIIPNFKHISTDFFIMNEIIMYSRLSCVFY